MYTISPGNIVPGPLILVKRALQDTNIRQIDTSNFQETIMFHSKNPVFLKSRFPHSLNLEIRWKIHAGLN